MAYLADLIVDQTPTGSSGLPVDFTGSQVGPDGEDCGPPFGLLVRPIGGPFPVTIEGGLSVSGSFSADNSDVVAAVESGSIGAVLVQQRFDVGGGSNDPFYIGYAPRGLATGSAGWTIKRITNVSGNPTATEWTDEGAAIWSNRASETYS